MSRCLDDHSLVEACRAGQTEAFGALVGATRTGCTQRSGGSTARPRTPRTSCKTRSCAAFQKLDQFQGDSSFYTWVYRIAVNLALSGHRRRRTRAWLGRKKRADGPHNRRSGRRSRPTPTRRLPLERAERERSSQAALSQLGPEHRAVVVLKDFDGHRYEEISAILEIPVGTVRTRSAPRPLRASRSAAEPGRRGTAGTTGVARRHVMPG